MTHISNWDGFIEKVTKVFEKDGWGHPSNAHTETEIVVPINEYQMGNLLYAFTKMRKQERAGKEVWCTGDWFNEILDIIYVTCKKLDIKELQGNCAPYSFNIEELNKCNWDLLKYDDMKTC